MPLYLDDKKTKLFKGDYKPMSVYWGDKKIAGYKYAEKSGEHIDFDGTYNDTANVVISGKSERVQTVQNVNLLDLTKLSYTKQGALTPIILANSVSLEMTCTETYGYITFVIPFDKIKGKTMYFKGITNSSNATKRMAIYALNSNNRPFGAGAVIRYSSPFDFSYTFPSVLDTANGIYGYGLLFYIRFQETDSTSIDYSNIIMSETDVPYEPFVPSSPSPDYPAEIYTVNNFDLVSAGRNLLDAANFVVGTLYGGGVGANFHISSSYKHRVSIILSVKPNTNYSIKIHDNDNLRLVRQSHFYSRDLKNCIADSYFYGTVKEATILTRDGAYILAISLGTIDDTEMTQDDINSLKVQLEFGPTATPYTPFRGMQSIHIPYALRGQGDMRDTIEYIGDGLWEYIQRRGRLVLDGSENWLETSTENQVETIRFSLFLGSSFSTHTFITSQFKRTTIATDDVESFYTAGNYIALRIKRSRLETNDMAGFKNYLAGQLAAGTPVICEGNLNAPAEPIYLTTEEIKTYYPYTQIYTTADIQPTLEGKFRVIGGISK